MVLKKKTAATFIKPSDKGPEQPRSNKTADSSVVFRVALGTKPVHKEVIKAYYGPTRASFPEVHQTASRDNPTSVNASTLATWDLKYWSRELGVDTEDLAKAIKRVGPSPTAVKAYMTVLKRSKA